MTNLHFQKYNDVRTRAPLQIIHSDICGPMPTESINVIKYFATFTDDFSKYCYIYILKQKCETLENFKEYKNEVEKLLNTAIISLQSENGTQC